MASRLAVRSSRRVISLSFSQTRLTGVRREPQSADTAPGFASRPSSSSLERAAERGPYTSYPLRRLARREVHAIRVVEIQRADARVGILA